jgi:hypothetical protein
MRILAAVLVLATVELSSMATDLPMVVEDSGSKEVDKFVLQLVSTRPAPYPSGLWPIPAQAETFIFMPYMSFQVSNAIVRLKEMGPSIFPYLIKHLRDDRYSYSDIVAAWLNHPVRDAVIEILSDGHYMFSGYKSRKTLVGSADYLSFEDCLTARNPEKWAAWASGKSRLQIQMDFIDWCISEEQKRGFMDEQQRKAVLGNYERAREEVRRQYSGPIKRNQPSGAPKD